MLKDADGNLKKEILNVTIIWLQNRPGFIKRPNPMDIINKGLVEVAYTGLGCMLISRNVLEKVSFKHNPRGTDDILFFKEAKAQGYKIYVDGGIILKHLHKLKRGQDWHDSLK